MPVSNKPWGDISESDYADAAQFCNACLMDFNPSGSEKVKGLCFLPYKEPSGTINVNGIQATAGARGLLRVQKPDGVTVSIPSLMGTPFGQPFKIPHFHHFFAYFSWFLSPDAALLPHSQCVLSLKNVLVKPLAWLVGSFALMLTMLPVLGPTKADFVIRIGVSCPSLVYAGIPTCQ